MKKILKAALSAVMCAAIFMSLLAIPASAETKDTNNPWKNKDINLQVIEDFSDTSYYKDGVQLRDYLNGDGGYDSLVERVQPDYHKTDVKVKNKQLVVVPYESDAIFWNLKKPVLQADMKKATGIGFYIKNNYGAQMCMAFYGSGSNSKEENAMWYYYGMKCTLVDKNFNVTTAKITYDQVQVPAGFEGWMLFDIADFINNNSAKRPKPAMVPGEFTLSRIGYRNYGSSTKAASAEKTLIIDDVFIFGKDVTHKQGDVKLPFVKDSASGGNKPSGSTTPSSKPSGGSNNSGSGNTVSPSTGNQSEVTDSSVNQPGELPIDGDDVKASVKGTIDGAPEGAALSVVRYTEGGKYNAAGNGLSGLVEKYALFGASLTLNNEEVALSEQVTLQFPGPGGFSKKKLIVYDMSGETPVEADWSVEDGNIVIKTDHLGLFAVGQKADTVAADPDKTADTNTNTDLGEDGKSGLTAMQIALIAAGVLVVLAAVVLIIVLTVKKKPAASAEKK